MRLLNVNTLRLEEFSNHDAPLYAILSHTWGEQEVTFKDLEDRSWETSEDKAEGRAKIKGCCALAAAEGFNYVWVDTCCINKWSSSELSEAINSMFRWYSESAVCYAYLSDVDSTQDPDAEDSDFVRSRWFTRGWTLQEMLAPTEVVFFGHRWDEIGTKVTLGPLVRRITGVSGKALTDRNWGVYSVAQKMSWAAGRETTRREDEAYCLLGLFNINMPLLYGEGERAFFRLQEEIMKRFDDESIFAWSYPSDEQSHVNLSGLLAPSPNYFKDASDVSIGAVRREEDMEMGKDTTEEYFFNTFELVRQLVRLRMPTLGPLRGIELDPGSSSVRDLKDISHDVDEISAKRTYTDTVDSQSKRQKATSGMALTKESKVLTPADNDHTDVPKLFLDPDDGVAIDLLDDHDDKQNITQWGSGSVAVHRRRSTASMDSDTAANWRWFIYDPVIIVPLMCSIHGKSLGLLLSVRPKEGRALYRVHYPSLVVTENMMGTFGSHWRLRTLYAYGLSTRDSGDVPHSLGKNMKVRIQSLIEDGYSFVEEKESGWLLSRSTGTLVVRDQWSREKPAPLILFEHEEQGKHPTFYVALDFDTPVIGILQGSTLPRNAWRVAERKNSRVEIPVSWMGKSIVLSWRQRKDGRLMNINIERSGPGVRQSAVSQISGGSFSLRLGLLMKDQSSLGAPVSEPKEHKGHREVSDQPMSM